MKRIIWMAVALGCLLSTTAQANTAIDALAVPYTSDQLFTKAGTPGDVWNTPIPANAVVEPDSAAQVAHLINAMGSPGRHPGHWWAAGFANYVVDGDTPLRTVCLARAIDGSFSTWEHYMAEHEILMTEKVPIPSDPSGDLPVKDGGPDRGATITSFALDKMWDFYKFRQAPPGTADQQGRTCDFVAQVGARMEHLSQNPGYFVNNPPHEFRDIARRAAKLPSLAGAVTPQEFNDPPQHGWGHVIQVSLPWARLHEWEWPAAQADAWSPWGYPAIREGSRFRFAPDTDCDRWTPQIDGATDPLFALYLRRIRALCFTGRDFGFIGGDQTGIGFAFNFRAGKLAPDGGYAPSGKPGGFHWWDQYWGALWRDLQRMQVIAPPDPAPEWAPTLPAAAPTATPVVVAKPKAKSRRHKRKVCRYGRRHLVVKGKHIAICKHKAASAGLSDAALRGLMGDLSI